MTRNRDDITVTQAIRTGLMVLVGIVTLMVVLGFAIADHKEAAKRKATDVADAGIVTRG